MSEPLLNRQTTHRHWLSESSPEYFPLSDEKTHGISQLTLSLSIKNLWNKGGHAQIPRVMRHPRSNVTLSHHGQPRHLTACRCQETARRCLSLSLIFYYLTLYRNSLISLPLLPNSGRLRQSLNPAFTTSATSPPKTSVFLLVFLQFPTTQTSIDKTILVPLTNSLYVPGHLSDPDHVIVDVGTGYFVKKVPFSFYNFLPSLLLLTPNPSHRHVLKPSPTTTKRSTISNQTSPLSKTSLQKSVTITTTSSPSSRQKSRLKSRQNLDFFNQGSTNVHVCV